jgi:hypothetical protein
LIIVVGTCREAAANQGTDANTVLTSEKANRTVQSVEAFIFLSSVNAIHSHFDSGKYTIPAKHLQIDAGTPRPGRDTGREVPGRIGHGIPGPIPLSCAIPAHRLIAFTRSLQVRPAATGRPPAHARRATGNAMAPPPTRAGWPAVAAQG